MDTISQIVKPSQISSSMGILMAMQSLGSMISPYVINGLTGIYTQVSAENAFKTGAIWSLGVAVFGFILGIVNKEKIMPLANEEKN
ncbi:hypothetical protein [Vagococcus acidifermentans]|uniref:Major facilitator superfamily (MFS) profile domain-containing protein n=1 Tax=Vagococcus acidifermentans TaxID=564710 RepID=A0A430AYZ4_9ENTE|nr:hypothetical protein [Vagococcus acidifermentans]RSU13255.1 hypothetical protein CBF27_03475 [Vagococcus acidifermentans]